MILYILRHGIAEDEAPKGDDRARRLTPRGRTRMRAAAAGMRALGLRFDVILTSPLVRAVETAAILADVYAGKPAPQELPALATGTSPAETVRALRPFARHEHVVIVGHEPGLSGIASLLLTGSATAASIELKKGGLIAVDTGQLLRAAGGARAGAALLWHLTPRQLRRMRR
jgi:phosphohistidine phosphatase